jgi:endonuclease YncB( thermonuclease family)
MIRKTLLAVAVLIAACAVFFSAPSISAAAGYGPYVAANPVVIDGDTVKVDVAIWPSVTVKTSIRLAGVDTPEVGWRAKCPEELLAGNAATAFTKNWIATHSPLTIDLVKPDDYPDRYDAEIVGADGTLLSGALLASGNARPAKGTRKPWCN